MKRTYHFTAAISDGLRKKRTWTATHIELS
jgi:hypothetical protein